MTRACLPLSALRVVTESRLSLSVTTDRGSRLDRRSHLREDHVYVHQVGPDQQAFLDFFAREVLPEFE